MEKYLYRLWLGVEQNEGEERRWGGGRLCPQMDFLPKARVPRRLRDTKTLVIQSSDEYLIGTFVWRVTYEQKINSS